MASILYNTFPLLQYNITIQYIFQKSGVKSTFLFKKLIYSATMQESDQK